MPNLLGPDVRRYRTWYVKEDREPVNWDSLADAGGLATQTVLRLVVDDDGRQQVSLWLRRGALVDPGQTAVARVGASTEEVPPVPAATPAAPSKYVTREELVGLGVQVHVMPTGGKVPDGLPDGTLVVEYAP